MAFVLYIWTWFVLWSSAMVYALVGAFVTYVLVKAFWPPTPPPYGIGRGLRAR